MYRPNRAPRTIGAQRVNGGHGPEWKKRPDPLAGIKHYLPRAADNPDTPEGAWRREAGRCYGAAMFHDPGNSTAQDLPGKIAASKRLCWGNDTQDENAVAECPARQACLAYALQFGENHGVWGGYTPRERTALRRELRKTAENLNLLARVREAETVGITAPELVGAAS